MASIVNQDELTNISEYPNTFKRQGSFPLEKFSVFNTLTEAQSYSTSNSVAYVGQIIVVANGTDVTAYIIKNTSGELVEMGKTSSSGDVSADVEILKKQLNSFSQTEDAVKNYIDQQDNSLQSTLTTYVDSKIVGLYTIKGKCTIAELPASANTGDVYILTDAGTIGDITVSIGDSVVWVDGTWTKMNSTVDLSGYQTKLTFDSTPTANSTNPVTSGGVKTALDDKLDKTDAVGKKTAEGGEIFNSARSAGNNAHAEGEATNATGGAAHSEGTITQAKGYASHAEGGSTTAEGNYSHTEGFSNVAKGEAAHAEGNGTKASSKYQHVQGKCNIEDTANKYAHIVGNGTADFARSNAHTLDWDGNAWYAGNVSVGGGYDSEGVLHGANQLISKADAVGTKTTDGGEIFNSAISAGSNAHAEGISTSASGMASHAEGAFTHANSKFQHVEGKFNIPDTKNKYIHIAGNGKSLIFGDDDNYTSNAHTLDWNGNAWFAGNVTVGGTYNSETGVVDGAKELATKEYVDSKSTGAYTIKGKCTIAELPASANTGDMYILTDSGTIGDITVSTGDSVVWVDSAWTKLNNTVDLSGYVTETELNTSLESKADKTEIPTKTSDLINNSGYITSIPSEYVTETELNAKGYLTKHQDLSGYQTKLIIDTDITDSATDTNIPSSKAVKTALDTKVECSVVEILVPNTGWNTLTDENNNTYYKYTISNDLFKSTSYPICDIVVSTDISTAKNEIESYSYLSRVSVNDGSVDLYCFENQPIISFNMRIQQWML